MDKKYYFAYGSNLNIERMFERYSSYSILGKYELQDYELCFKGTDRIFANIIQKKGSFVPGVIYELDSLGEEYLNYYEGHPVAYRNIKITVEYDSKNIEIFTYEMTEQKGLYYGIPSFEYYNMIKEGYRHFGLNLEILKNALVDSSKKAINEMDNNY